MFRKWGKQQSVIWEEIQVLEVSDGLSQAPVGEELCFSCQKTLLPFPWGVRAHLSNLGLFVRTPAHKRRPSTSGLPTYWGGTDPLPTTKWKQNILHWPTAHGPCSQLPQGPGQGWCQMRSMAKKQTGLLTLKAEKHPCAMPCLVIQSCLTLCDPMDWSPPASSVHEDSPGKNTGVGCHALLQGIFPTQGSNPGLLYHRWTLYCLSHHGSPRILEWVVYPFSKGSSQPRNQTKVSCAAGGFFTSWAAKEAPK